MNISPFRWWMGSSGKSESCGSWILQSSGSMMQGLLWHNAVRRSRACVQELAAIPPPSAADEVTHLGGRGLDIRVTYKSRPPDPPPKAQQ